MAKPINSLINIKINTNILNNIDFIIIFIYNIYSFHITILFLHFYILNFCKPIILKNKNKNKKFDI